MVIRYDIISKKSRVWFIKQRRSKVRIKKVGKANIVSGVILIILAFILIFVLANGDKESMEVGTVVMKTTNIDELLSKENIVRPYEIKEIGVEGNHYTVVMIDGEDYIINSETYYDKYDVGEKVSCWMLQPKNGVLRIGRIERSL